MKEKEGEIEDDVDSKIEMERILWSSKVGKIAQKDYHKC